MSTTRRETLSITCPGCGGTFLVSSELAGRRGRCQSCGARVTIPAPDAPPTEPELFGVLCRLCDTPLYGTREQIGGELKCPDCGARTRLPPPKPKRKNTPVAMEGEQYELWNVDESPVSYISSSAGAVRSIPVSCWLCDTLMYATAEQIGSELTCPDCGSRTVVGPLVEPKAAAPVLVPEGQEYQSLPPAAMRIAPVLDAETERRILEEDEAGRGGSKFDTEREQQRKRRRKLDAYGRPILPRWPTITGVFPFLGSPGVVTRLCVLTVVGTLGLWAMVFSVALLAGMNVLGVFLLAGAVLFSFLIFSAFAANLMAIVVESSDGSDEVNAWPPVNFPEWWGEALYMTVAITVAAAPGWGIARLAGLGPLETLLCIGGSLLVWFPLVLLSQLDIGSPAAIVSGKMLASYGRRPLTWLLFLVESALLLAACVGVLLAAAVIHPAILFLLPPMGVIGLFLYARILGRLAWSIAEATPADEPVEESE